eukprot:5352103-Lingulodinium_polyedra.AAC.1
MMNRPSVATAVCVPRARAFHARAKNWRARGVRERAICEPPWPRTVDSTSSRRSVTHALRNDVAR